MREKKEQKKNEWLLLLTFLSWNKMRMQLKKIANSICCKGMQSSVIEVNFIRLMSDKTIARIVKFKQT